MNRHFSVLGAVLAASVPMALAAPASAQFEESPTSVRVQTADLDLSSPAGAHALLRRIDSAAEAACGGAPDIRLLTQMQAYKSCRATAIQNAVTQAHSAMVAAIASGERAFDRASR
ncbi:MAG: UrcA family protein [Caulobacteraceae bacterium]